MTKLVREALATEDLRGQPRRKGRRKGKHCVKRRRAVRAARQNALASAVARTWKVSKKERVAAANMAAEVIGRAVKNWREATVARRATAAEMIGRTIKRWTETMPCWIENWRTVLADRYGRCKIEERPGLVALWRADKCLRRFVWHAERRWLARRVMAAGRILRAIRSTNMRKSLRAESNAELGRCCLNTRALKRFWRAHPTVQYPEKHLYRDFEKLLQDWGLEWFQECFGDSRWREWVIEWNDGREDGLEKQIMMEAILVGDKVEGIEAVALYANHQLEEWMEQWQFEAEIIAENRKSSQRQERKKRSSDGQAGTKKGRWKRSDNSSLSDLNADFVEQQREKLRLLTGTRVSAVKSGCFNFIEGLVQGSYVRETGPECRIRCTCPENQ